MSVMQRMTRRQHLQSMFTALGALTVGGCGATTSGGSARSAPTASSMAGKTSTSDLIHLDLNESPFGPSPRAIEAMQAELTKVARYTSEGEVAALTATIASIESVRDEQVVLGEVLEPLGLHLAQTTGHGAEVVYSTPGYTALTDAAKVVGGAGIGVPLSGTLENDLPSLGARVGERTAALFLVNPHNPSGTVSDAAALFAFVREISKRTLVIVDEAYLEYLGDFAARTCAALVREGSNVVVFRTFSKIYGFAGLPMGYALMPASLADRLRDKGVGHARSLSRLAVAAAGASVRDASFIDSVRAKVAGERARWTATLDELGLRHSDARGNFVFFETGRPHAAFAAAMRARGIDIGRMFPPLDTWARISIGLPDENDAAQAALRANVRA